MSVVTASVEPWLASQYSCLPGRQTLTGDAITVRVKAVRIVGRPASLRKNACASAWVAKSSQLRSTNVPPLFLHFCLHATRLAFGFFLRFWVQVSAVVSTTAVATPTEAIPSAERTAARRLRRAERNMAGIPLMRARHSG